MIAEYSANLQLYWRGFAIGNKDLELLKEEQWVYLCFKLEDDGTMLIAEVHLC